MSPFGESFKRVEAFKPRYPLRTIKALIKKKAVISPNIKVLQSATEIGFSIEEAYEEILNLERKDFRKSITEYFNHRVWQDVYKKRIKDVPVYIKFKIVKRDNCFLLLSFKKDEQK